MPPRSTKPLPSAINDRVTSVVEWALAWRGVEKTGDEAAAAVALSHLREAADALFALGAEAPASSSHAPKKRPQGRRSAR